MSPRRQHLRFASDRRRPTSWHDHADLCELKPVKTSCSDIQRETWSSPLSSRYLSRRARFATGLGSSFDRKRPGPPLVIAAVIALRPRCSAGSGESRGRRRSARHGEWGPAPGPAASGATVRREPRRRRAERPELAGKEVTAPVRRAPCPEVAARPPLEEPEPAAQPRAPALLVRAPPEEAPAVRAEARAEPAHRAIPSTS